MTEAEQQIEGMLRMTAVASMRLLDDMEYAGFADLIRREGKFFPPGKIPENTGYLEPKQCFRNAWFVASLSDEYTYTEGYATTGVLPVHHAWLVDKEGRVYDPTWKPAQLKSDESEWAYLGIELPIELVDKILRAKAQHGVLDDWRNDWPLLKEPFSIPRAMEIYDKLLEGVEDE